MSINWGPSGEDVYNRTYSRTKPDGTKETWPDTVRRAVNGNLNLIPWKDDSIAEYTREYLDLVELIENFGALPAGRHLWASGVKGRQYLYNCWVSGWPAGEVAEHFRFSFLRLMEGGGVGANYATSNLTKYGPARQTVEVHVVCDSGHQDYEEMKSAGLLSEIYNSDYQGAYLEVEDSREGWADALVDVIESAWSDQVNPVRVFDVSRVRPKGARLKTFGGVASGPGPLAKMLLNVARTIQLHCAPTGILFGETLNPAAAMQIDHYIAECVVSGGNRRSARMSILPWDDPYISWFLKCKEDPSQHWTTNISVAVDHHFLNRLESGDEATLILERIAAGMVANGEPGIWNQSLSQVGELGHVDATNPCGEICLEDFEPCNLGHINLDYFAPTEERPFFDLTEATEAVRIMVRFLIRATFGDVNDPKSRAILDQNRRIGVGLLGVQSALAKMGIRYSEAPDNWEWKDILDHLKWAARDEARAYAFKLRIPEPVKVTTVAPTGTIAKMPGVTEGIHPIFSRYFIRRIRFSTLDPDQVARVEQYKVDGYKVEPDLYADNTMVVEIPTKEKLVAEVEALGLDASIVEAANELTPEELFRFQETIQKYWADNAVSFTANIDPGTTNPRALATTLTEFLPTLKGTTVFPEVSRPQSPYERISADEFDALTRDRVIQVADSIDEECSNGICPIR
ncbi:ribonucleoside-triphosphate reductase, adenosylcobalamin-dependent [Nonomuraea sp. NPDC059007]|uniref:ribonucleoside-triphosphate reductase, adenosylcobalamin-dependent n=1 Tax=Nonomuraea sp. NPDC059007 TaxID=3346692 RepID=UPI0036CA4BC7